MHNPLYTEPYTMYNLTPNRLHWVCGSHPSAADNNISLGGFSFFFFFFFSVIFDNSTIDRRVFKGTASNFGPVRRSAQEVFPLRKFRKMYIHDCVCLSNIKNARF